MKLNRNQYKQMCSRLDRLVVIVALLWLATSLALLFSYSPESAQTVRQHKTVHGSVASHVLKLPLGRL
jgi:preprotein translocase subunit SecG